MNNLEAKIKELKAGRTLATLKKEDRKAYYKVRSLSAKLSEEKAAAKGNFITKEHLTEYKGLIIWILKNKVDYRGFLNLKKAMTMILESVQNNDIVYITEKGIKSIVVNIAIGCGNQDVNDNFREFHGIEATANTFMNPLLEDLQQHQIGTKM